MTQNYNINQCDLLITEYQNDIDTLMHIYVNRVGITMKNKREIFHLITKCGMIYVLELLPEICQQIIQFYNLVLANKTIIYMEYIFFHNANMEHENDKIFCMNFMKSELFYCAFHNGLYPSFDFTARDEVGNPYNFTVKKNTVLFTPLITDLGNDYLFEDLYFKGRLLISMCRTGFYNGIAITIK